VRFFGKYPRREIPGFLAASDASLVVLRNREIFKTVIPSKMVEAMAMAKPIILGVEGEARETLQEVSAGIAITPESAKELVDAINVLMADRDSARRMGENGRQFVVHQRDRKELGSKLVAILERVVRDQSGV